MLNICGLTRPLMAVAFSVLMLSIVAPTFFDRNWPYIAAVGVVAVPWIIYRWWNARWNPGCGVRLPNYNPDEDTPISIREVE